MNDDRRRETGRPSDFQRSDNRERQGGRRQSPLPIDLGQVRLQEKPSADLFDTVAESAARVIADARPEENKASQIRRFYDELTLWQAKVGKSQEAFTDAEPYIRMLKAKVAYANGRGHVDENFRTLFSHVIDQAANPQTLHRAKIFMEAFMAFYKVYRRQ